MTTHRQKSINAKIMLWKKESKKKLIPLFFVFLFIIWKLAVACKDKTRRKQKLQQMHKKKARQWKHKKIHCTHFLIITVILVFLMLVSICVYIEFSRSRYSAGCMKIWPNYQITKHWKMMLQYNQKQRFHSWQSFWNIALLFIADG